MGIGLQVLVVAQQDRLEEGTLLSGHSLDHKLVACEVQQSLTFAWGHNRGPDVAEGLGVRAGVDPKHLPDMAEDVRGIVTEMEAAVVQLVLGPKGGLDVPDRRAPHFEVVALAVLAAHAGGAEVLGGGQGLGPRCGHVPHGGNDALFHGLHDLMAGVPLVDLVPQSVGRHFGSSLPSPPSRVRGCHVLGSVSTPPVGARGVREAALMTI
mmetsp:Transcript_150575/g.263156  ORF Transcript_150575/g.263156 Transcript_150575/m.263156 type:complete len:209 (+) Transcript_150575:587-1213(+)